MTAPPTKCLTGTRCLCRGCGEYFNRTSTFTAHRVGPYAPINKPDTRRCLTVAEMQAKGWTLNAAGFWMTAKPQFLARRSRAGAAISATPSPDSGSVHTPVGST